MARPTLLEYNPSNVKPQSLFINDFFNRVKNRKGLQIIVLSGAVGSGKSISVHYALSILNMEKKIKTGIVRWTLPDLKKTLYSDLISFIPEQFVQRTLETTGYIELINGSEFVPYTFADKKYKKVRSFEANIFVVEEAVEHPTDGAIDEIIQRLGRDENLYNTFLFVLTNPDSPKSWFHKKFIAKAGYVDGKKVMGENLDDNIHLYYSKTLDNPHLPTEYKTRLEQILDPKTYQRMVEGKWIDIMNEAVYYCYDKELDYTAQKYEPTKDPIRLCFDFNTAEKKPMSAVALQYNKEQKVLFNIFKAFIRHKSNTHELMTAILADDEFMSLLKDRQLIINADATARQKKSSATKTDLDIIKEFLDHYSKFKINYKISVPMANPGVKERVNLVNSMFCNVQKERRTKIWNVPEMDEGFAGTQWKKNSDSTIDDTFEFQHGTDCVGYGMVDSLKKGNSISIE